MLLSLIIQVKHHNPDEFWSSNHWDTFGHTSGYPIKASKFSSDLTSSELVINVGGGGLCRCNRLGGWGKFSCPFPFLTLKPSPPGLPVCQPSGRRFLHLLLFSHENAQQSLLCKITIRRPKSHQQHQHQHQQEASSGEETAKGAKAAWVLQGSCRCRWWLSLEL